MRDEFDTARLVDNVNGTPAEPGPGNRLVVDTGHYITIANGELVFSSGGGSVADPILWLDSVTRANGAGVFARVYHNNVSTAGVVGPRVGFAGARTATGINNQGVMLALGQYNTNSVSVGLREMGTDIAGVGSYSNVAVYHDLAVILRPNNGALYFIKSGTSYPHYTLLRVTEGSGGNEYPFVMTTYRTSQIAFLRCADASQAVSGLATQFGAASAYSATSGAVLTGSANTHMVAKWVCATNDVLTLLFRRTDDDNCLKLVCTQSANTIKLYKREAGVDTELDAGKTQTWTNGTTYYIYITANGSTIKTYVGVTAKHSTTQAFNATATTATASGFATGEASLWAIGTDGEWDNLQGFFTDSDLNPPEQVLFIGGSITAGGTSTNPFQTQLITWWNTTYRDKKYVRTSLSNSGCGSWTSLARMAELQAVIPDMVVIDYAVNDGEVFLRGSAPNYARGAAEALIRRIRTLMPNAAISLGIYTWPDEHDLMDATKRAARDLWLALATHYGLQIGANLATEIRTIEGEPLTQVNIDKYFPAHNDVHPNDLGHTTITNAFKAAWAVTPFPNITQDWTPPLPSRLYSESVDFEYEPVTKLGTANDGETGTWTTVGTARSSSSAGSTISYSGTFASFGMSASGTGGSFSWRIDGGSWSASWNISQYMLHQLIWYAGRGSHTVDIKVDGGTVQINDFVMI
jgi:hypothetical protein